jgi:hypothetical protein
MKRKNVAFDVTIVAPTTGLVTRIPANQIDSRAASVASNIRFDQGVARNAEGYGRLKLNPTIDGPTNLIFQGELAPKNGQRRIPAIVATAQRIWSVLRFPVGYAPPTVVGILDVSEDGFKDWFSSGMFAGQRLYAVAYGSSASSEMFFTEDPVSKHFFIGDSAVLVEDDMLDLSPILLERGSDINYIAFYITNFSDYRFFLLGGEVYLDVSATPVPPMVDATLVETYSGGPQEVTIQNQEVYQFHIKAVRTFIPES